MSGCTDLQQPFVWGRRLHLAEQHSQDPRMVAPEDASFCEVRATEDFPSDENWDIVTASGLVSSVQHPRGAGGVGDFPRFNHNAKGQRPNAVFVDHTHLQAE